MNNRPAEVIVFSKGCTSASQYQLHVRAHPYRIDFIELGRGVDNLPQAVARAYEKGYRPLHWRHVGKPITAIPQSALPNA